MDILLGAFALVTLWGINKPQISGIQNREGLSRSDTNAIRGILAILIVFHHLSLATGNGYFTVILKRLGYIIVGAFYAFSGYGLTSSYQRKSYSLDHFWKKRFYSVLLPYFIVSLIYVAVRLCMGEHITIGGYLHSFINGAPVVRYSWFIITIIIFYGFFFLATWIGKDDIPLIIALVFLMEVVFIYVMRKLHYEDFWINAAWAFPLGMLWSFAYPHISKTVSRHPWFYISSAIILFLIFFYSSSFLYWCGFYGEMITACSFSVLVFLILFKISFNNVILQFLGTISFEIYMIHGLFVMIFSAVEQVLNKPILFSLLVIGISILCAWLLHKVFSAFQNKAKKNQL